MVVAVNSAGGSSRVPRRVTRSSCTTQVRLLQTPIKYHRKYMALGGRVRMYIHTRQRHDRQILLVFRSNLHPASSWYFSVASLFWPSQDTAGLSGTLSPMAMRRTRRTRPWSRPISTCPDRSRTTKSLRRYVRTSDVFIYSIFICCFFRLPSDYCILDYTCCTSISTEIPDMQKLVRRTIRR